MFCVEIERRFLIGLKFIKKIAMFSGKLKQQIISKVKIELTQSFS